VGAAQEPPAGDRQVQETPRSSSASGARSFLGDTFENLRHVAGFSIGTYEIYESNTFDSSGSRQSATVTVFFPRVFLNLGRRRSRFHADVGIGYRIYNQRREFDSSEQYAVARYSYEISRRTSIRFSNEFASSPNWSSAFLSPVLSPSDPTPGFSTEVFLERQRITRNSARATFGYQPTRNISFGVFSNFQSYRFDNSQMENVNAVQAGISYDHQLTRWLFLSNSYSSYLNRVDQRLQDAQVHRLQIGGFRFRLGPGWEASVGGGVEYAKTSRERSVGETVTAALSWSTEANTFALSYHRGFYSAIGLARLMQSNQATAAFGSRLRRWLNLRIAATYLRGLGADRAGRMEYYTTHAGLDFAIRRDLIASLSGLYVNQRGRDLSLFSLDRERYSAFVGLQYLFPGSQR
jgi:hypothetical protein